MSQRVLQARIGAALRAGSNPFNMPAKPHFIMRAAAMDTGEVSYALECGRWRSPPSQGVWWFDSGMANAWYDAAHYYHWGWHSKL